MSFLKELSKGREEKILKLRFLFNVIQALNLIFVA